MKVPEIFIVMHIQHTSILINSQKSLRLCECIFKRFSGKNFFYSSSIKLESPLKFQYLSVLLLFWEIQQSKFFFPSVWIAVWKHQINRNFSIKSSKKSSALLRVMLSSPSNHFVPLKDNEISIPENVPLWYGKTFSDFSFLLPPRWVEAKRLKMSLLFSGPLKKREKKTEEKSFTGRPESLTRVEY